MERRSSAIGEDRLPIALNSLDTSDRRLLIAAVAVMLILLGVTYALAPAPAQKSMGFPSSYSSEWAGAKAAFLLLNQLGYRAERWEKAPEELPIPAAGTILIIAEPFEKASGADLTALRRFVSSGGCILVTGASGAALVPEATATEPEVWNPESKTYSALLPSPLTRGAPAISMVAPDTWTADNESQLFVYGTDETTVVVSYHVGKGEVIWWASPSPLTNAGLRESGNLAFFLNVVGPSTPHVLWDEYFHGARASMGSYLARTPLPWAGVQLAFAFIVILFTFSRRNGPIRAPAGESRLSPLEFVETLGDLYQCARAATAPVSIAYQRFRLSLSRRLALPSKAKLPELCRAASARFGWPENSLLDTLARSERAMRNINLDEKEALYLVRQLHDYSARLEPSGRSEQEIRAWR
jgi:hypothetical protein